MKPEEANYSRAMQELGMKYERRHRRRGWWTGDTTSSCCEFSFYIFVFRQWWALVCCYALLPMMMMLMACKPASAVIWSYHHLPHPHWHGPAQKKFTWAHPGFHLWPILTYLLPLPAAPTLLQSPCSPHWIFTYSNFTSTLGPILSEYMICKSRYMTLTSQFPQQIHSLCFGTLPQSPSMGPLVRKIWSRSNHQPHLVLVHGTFIWSNYYCNSYTWHAQKMSKIN